MNYEKAYKEALERAKDIKNGSCPRDGSIATADYIFPELKESEDERIRKEIIEFISWAESRGSVRSDWHQKKCPGNWITYLEKQKEQKTDAKSERVIKAARRVLNNWLDGTDCPDVSGDFTELEYAIREYDGEEKQKEQKDYNKLYEDIAKSEWFKKAYEGKSLGCDYEQKEQKPADKQDYTGLTDLERAIHRGFLCAGVENVPVTIIKETAQECLARMKPAEWNKEEEIMLARCVAAIPTLGDEIRPASYLDKLRTWLKSLPERFNLQPKEEWDEEDEKMISFYEADYNNQIGDMSMKDVINMRLKFKNWLVNRLKSLRPQPKQEWSEEDRQIARKINDVISGNLKLEIGYLTSEERKKMSDWFISMFYSHPKSSDNWRPSKEQMKELKLIINGKAVIRTDFIRTLYNDLKKLI